MRRTRIRGLAAALAGALFLAGAPQMALGSDTASRSLVTTTVHNLVTITVKATGRDGGVVNVGQEAVALPLFAAPQSRYVSNGGVLTVPPGKYLLAVRVDADPVAPTYVGSSTLAARVVTAMGNVTVAIDARQGKLVAFGLNAAGVAAAVAAIGVCYGKNGEPFMSASTSAVIGHNDLYAVPFANKSLALGYSATWRDTSGTWYETTASNRGGIPARPGHSWRVADLARLVLPIRSGTAAGSDGTWDLRQASGCILPTPLEAEQPVTVPSQLSLYASAGRWLVRFFPDDHSGQSSTIFNAALRAGLRYVQVIDGAVAGPTKGTLPRYGGRGRNTVSIVPNAFFGGPDGGFQCCVDGVLTLSTGGKVVQVVKFSDNNGDTVRLPRPGRYSLTVVATRAVPPPGVTASVLSPKVSLTWGFRASAADLRSLANLPVSAATFVPGHLDLANDAVPGAVTPLRITVWRGQRGSRFRLKSVRLQVSANDGAAWRSVALGARVGYWLAQIRDPASGFLSLRVTVTDAQGDSTVETIYRAYGIS